MDYDDFTDYPPPFHADDVRTGPSYSGEIGVQPVSRLVEIHAGNVPVAEKS